MSGGFFGSVLGVLILPILSRIYSDSDFGTMQLFVSIITNLAILTTLRFPSGIVLPKSKDERNSLIALCLLCTLIGGFLLTVFILVFKEFWLGLLSEDIDLGSYIYLIPLGVIVLSINDVLSNWDVRDKEFKKMTTATIAGQVAGSGAKLLFGTALLSKLISGGLILGTLFQHVLRFLIRLKSRFVDILYIIRNVSFDNIKLIAWKFIDFPLFMLPGNWINNFSRELPVFILASASTSSLLGQYAFANLLLVLPFSVLSRSVSPVFLQKANELSQIEGDNLLKFVENLSKKLTLIGVFPFGVAMCFGDIIIPILFGEEWRLAGELVSYISAYLLIRLLFTPIAPIFRVLGKEKYTLIVGVVLFALRITGLAIGFYLFENALAGIKFYCLFSLLGYLVAVLLVFDLLHMKIAALRLMAFYMVPVLGALFLIRILLIGL